MRVKVTFSSDKPIVFSTCYNRAIQGCIYNLMNPDFSNWLHDEGFNVDGRSLKLFTFSRLFGPFTRRGDLIVFDTRVELYVSSPVDAFMAQLCNNLLKSEIQLETNMVRAEAIDFLRKPSFSSTAIVKTLSPITVYSTLLTPRNTKKTYYYSPYENEFSTLIRENLLRKAGVLGYNAKGEFKVEPVGRVKDTYITFKGTVIRGWTGKFKVSGDQSLLEVGYEAGLGSKNSAGFGMIEVIHDV